MVNQVENLIVYSVKSNYKNNIQPSSGDNPSLAHTGLTIDFCVIIIIGVIIVKYLHSTGVNIERIHLC